ncbi:MAG: O-antigen ligase family protein [Clostridia bacterium]|nr:O-antigen ligase family protein [Clostridia bacterium]
MTTTEKQGRWPEWVTTVLGMLWLALFPLWQDGSYSRITRSKWLGMLLLTGVTAVACGHMLATLAGRGEWRRHIRLTWLHAAAAAYFTLVALSAVYGSWADYNNDGGQLTVIWGAKRYEGLITQGCYGLIFLCMSLTRVRLRPLLDAAAYALLAYGAIVCLQYHDVNVLELFPVGTSIHTNYEFQGPIGNIDMVVGYLSIAGSALLGGFAWLERPRWLWLAAGLAGVLLLLLTEVQCGFIMLAAMLFALLLMALRHPDCRWRTLLILSGTLAMVSIWLTTGMPWLHDVEELCFVFDWWRLLPLLAGVALAAAALYVHRRPGPAPGWRWIAAIAAGLVAAALLAVYLLPFPAGSGLWEMQEILHGRAQDAYGSERIGIWRLTLEMSREGLLWGTGPDTFLYAMDDYLWRTGQSLEQHFDNPHNLVLGVLSNNGLPATVMFLVLTAGAVVCGLLRSGKDRAALPLTLAVMCYLAQGMFTFSICLVTPMFFAALGMLTGQLNDRKPEGKDDKDEYEPDPQLCVPPQGVDGDQAADVGADCGGAAVGAAGTDQSDGDAADQG